MWFKGIDVAKLLDLEHPTMPVQIHVTPENQKVDPQTMFINQEGMYDLVMSSRKPEAKIFRRWISHEVLPSINRFGSYSIEKKYGCFYDDHDLYEYDGCNVCYMMTSLRP